MILPWYCIPGIYCNQWFCFFFFFVVVVVTLHTLRERGKVVGVGTSYSCIVYCIHLDALTYAVCVCAVCFFLGGGGGGGDIAGSKGRGG